MIATPATAADQGQAMSASVSVAVKSAAKTTGEGPHWDQKTKSLYYVDILSNDLHRWDSVTGVDAVKHLDGNVSLVVPTTNGDLLVSSGRQLCRLDWQTGLTQTIVEVDQGTSNRFNDGKCDALGRLWAGTMGLEETPANPIKEMGSLYSLDLQHNIRKHQDKISISNGLAWTSDNRTMFYIDSLPRVVYVQQFNLQSGTYENQRVLLDFSKTAISDYGFPDGMCIDQEDRIWVAFYKASKVCRFDPETGKELQSIALPAERITSCCFGGEDYSELYVTSGRHPMSDAEVAAIDPLAGSVFKISGLGVKGVAPQIYMA